MSKQGRKAWLVTWEHAGDHAQPTRRIAAVLRPQLTGRRVRDLVACLYAASEYSPADMLRALDPKFDPYPARFDSINGVTFEGIIICGHNPFLLARLVDDLAVGHDGNATWTDRSRPTLPEGFRT